VGGRDLEIAALLVRSDCGGIGIKVIGEQVMTTAARRARNSASGRSRRGYLSLELVFVLPILSVVLMALFEFSMLFFARGSVVEASRVGARAASLHGADAKAVEAEVRKVLAQRLQPGMSVEVETGKHSGDVVAVAVRVPMGAATPDLLWPVGYSLAGRNLYCETRMIKE
jgi:Flp pilus assembly protein TadG